MATSNYTAILTAIVAVVDGATGTANVHDYQRLGPDWTSFLALMRDPVDTDLVHGWTVSRQSAPEKPLTNLEHERHHFFILRGYMGVADANETEKTFNLVLEAVCADLQLPANWNLSGAAESSNPPNIRTIDYRVFGAVLCHYAEIEFTVVERLARA